MSKKKKEVQTEIDYSSMIVEEQRPKSTKGKTNPFYEGILRAVSQAEGKSFRIPIPEGTQLKSAYYTFRNRIRDSTYETLLEVHITKNNLYIVKK